MQHRWSARAWARAGGAVMLCAGLVVTAVVPGVGEAPNSDGSANAHGSVGPGSSSPPGPGAGENSGSGVDSDAAADAEAAAAGADEAAEEYEEIEVLSIGVIAGPEDEFQVVLPGEKITRIVGSNAVDPEIAAQQRQWLQTGIIPGPAKYHDMAERALLDLHMLMQAPDALPGAVVAAPTGIWKYVWPRDASFIAVALARTGHLEEAEEILRFFTRVQRPDGLFEARYLPDGSGVPDDRPLQFDGCGWVPWAVAEWYSHAPSDDRDEAAAEFLPMVLGCLTAVESRVDTITGLPDPSPDYWEVAETEATLGSTADLLLGARQTARFLTDLDAAGRQREIDRAQTVAGHLDWGIYNNFARAGFPRRLTAPPRDAAVAFLMPPFTDQAEDRAIEAWSEALENMRRPAGGVAPGESWPQDGISWTPQTSLAALVAAARGETREAHRWLTWLDENRTALGSIPEKVQSDGTPGDVAPLGWSAALTLLTLLELEGKLM